MFTNGQTVNMQSVMKDNVLIQKLLALIAAEKAKEIEETGIELEKVRDGRCTLDADCHWLGNVVILSLLIMTCLI